MWDVWACVGVKVVRVIGRPPRTRRIIHDHLHLERQMAGALAATPDRRWGCRGGAGLILDLQELHFTVCQLHVLRLMSCFINELWHHRKRPVQGKVSHQAERLHHWCSLTSGHQVPPELWNTLFDLFLLWKWEIRASAGLLRDRCDSSVGLKHPEGKFRRSRDEFRRGAGGMFESRVYSTCSEVQFLYKSIEARSVRAGASLRQSFKSNEFSEIYHWKKTRNAQCSAEQLITWSL